MKSKIFIICLLLLLIFPLNVFAKTYPVIWNPEKMEETIGLVGKKNLTVTFTSSTDLKNVGLWVVPELQPFVSLIPNHFAVINKNTLYNVDIAIAIPYGTQTGLYNGTIHLKVGPKTYPQTLKISLHAVDLMTGAISPPDTIPETTTIQYITEDGTLVDIEVVKGQVIVLFNSIVSESSAEGLIVSNGGSIIATIPSIRYYLVSVPSGDEINFINKMRQESNVILAIPNIPLEPLQVEPPNEWKDKSDWFYWHLKKIKADLAWELVNGLALSEKKISIIDEIKGGSFNGLNAGLKDFEGRIVGTVPAQLPWLLPSEGHGTKVTAIAAAMGNNDFGNVGVNWKSKISFEAVITLFDAPYEVLSSVYKGADVINLSIGIPTCFGMQEFYLDPLFAVVNSARILFPSKKFLVVQAAGNNGCELVSYFKPNYNPKPDNLILVGGTNRDGNKLDISNFGSLIDIAAPGIFEILYYSTGKLETEMGTSLAAPLVTGAAALVWAKEPDLTPQQVIQRLKDTAQPFTNLEDQYKGKFGAGILDVYKALVGVALDWITCAACPEPPEVSIDGNTITMGQTGDSEGGTQNTSVHGAAAILPPASSYSVTFTFSLVTWDSYNAPGAPNPPFFGGTGWWDSFSVSVSQAPYWELGLTDPVSTANLPGLGFLWGGLSYGDGFTESNSGTLTVILPGNPGGTNYLNVVLDTASLPDANHNYPSWGTITILDVAAQ